MSNKTWLEDWKKWSKCEWRNWTTFQLTTNKDKVIIPPNYQKDLDVVGMYIIFANNNLDNGFSFKMPQNQDKWGILTIGESINLRTRIQAFMLCAGTPINEILKGGHSAGNLFYYLKLAKKLPLAKLWVSFLAVGDIDNSFYGQDKLNEGEFKEAQKLTKKLEYELTLSYVLHHGDLPILTSQLQKPNQAQNIDEQDFVINNYQII